MTSKAEIRSWLLEKKDKGFSHMVVFCDTYDHGDYPTYCPEGTDIHEFIKGKGGNMTRLMEVYSYRKDLEPQLNEFRAKNYD